MGFTYIFAAAAALSSFFIASLQDLKSREVDDILWIASGITGLVISIYALITAAGGDVVPALTAALPAFLFADMFIDWERLPGKSGTVLRYSIGGISALSTFASAYTYSGFIAVDAVAAASLWILFIFLLFHLDVIKGGADAKALVCLVLLFPTYPQPVLGHVLPVYVSFTFPFFINTLLLAAGVSLAVPLMLSIRNAGKGDVVLPMMFLGYRKKLDEVVLEKEWMMQYPADGGIPVRLRKLGSSDDAKILRDAAAAGWKTVWVSPKIPFIVPMTVGLLLTLLFGNILLYV